MGQELLARGMEPNGFYELNALLQEKYHNLLDTHDFIKAGAEVIVTKHN